MFVVFFPWRYLIFFLRHIYCLYAVRDYIPYMRPANSRERNRAVLKIHSLNIFDEKMTLSNRPAGYLPRCRIARISKARSCGREMSPEPKHNPSKADADSANSFHGKIKKPFRKPEIGTAAVLFRPQRHVPTIIHRQNLFSNVALRRNAIKGHERKSDLRRLDAVKAISSSSSQQRIYIAYNTIITYQIQGDVFKPVKSSPGADRDDRPRHLLSSCGRGHR